jgi:DNA repair exonuclease SbcCD nuclease subunit
VKLSSKFDNLKILATGDWHYTSYSPWGGQDESGRYRRCVDLEKHIGNMVAKDNWDLAFVLGDIFEEVTPDNLSRKMAAHFIGSLFYRTNMLDGSVVVINGNHDAKDNQTAIDDWAQFSLLGLGPKILTSQNVITSKEYPYITVHNIRKKDSICCGVIPFAGVETQRTLLSLMGDESCDLVIGHCDVKNTYMQPGVRSPAGLGSTEIARVLRPGGLCLLGHYHVAQQWVVDGKLFAYVGAPMRTTFHHEKMQPGYTVINDGELKFYPILDRRFITIENMVQLENTGNGVMGVDGNIIRVMCPDVKTRLQIIHELNHHYKPFDYHVPVVKVPNLGMVDGLDDHANVDIGLNIPGAITKHVEEKYSEDKEGIKELAIKVYDAVS